MTDLQQRSSADSNTPVISAVGSPKPFRRANLPKNQSTTQGRKLMARTRKGKNTEVSFDTNGKRVP